LCPFHKRNLDHLPAFVVCERFANLLYDVVWLAETRAVFANFSFITLRQRFVVASWATKIFMEDHLCPGVMEPDLIVPHDYVQARGHAFFRKHDDLAR
jgi:hypothetical protein